MVLTVTKSSEKAICRREEEREEPDDASKQQRRRKGSPEAADFCQATAGFFMSYPNIPGISWQG